MRKPSEYIAAAVKGLRRQMPDSTGTLSFGGVSAPYTRLGSVSSGEDDMASDAPVEAFRIAALAADFPALTKSDSVFLREDAPTRPDAASTDYAKTGAVQKTGGASEASEQFSDIHLVTSVKRDVSGSLLHIGLSYALSRHEATVQGMRGSRRINVPVSILATLSGYVTDIPDGFTSSTVRAYTLLIAVDGWLQKEPPQIGDIVRFTYKDALVVASVSSVKIHDGYYYMDARSRR